MDEPTRPAHLGAFIHLAFRHRWATRWIVIVGLILVTLLTALVFIPQNFIPSEFIRATLIAVLMAESFWLLHSAWKSSQKLFYKILSSDLWIALFLIAPVFVPWPTSLADFLEFSLVDYWGRLFFGVVWIALRVGESLGWSRLCKGAFLDQSILWEDLLERPVLRCQIIRFLSGFVILGVAVAVDSWASPDFLWSQTALLGLAAFCLPTSLWLSTKLILKSEKEKWKVFDYPFFENLRLKRLAILQSFGVLSDGAAVVKNLWIDESPEWPRGDIEEVLLQIGQANSHPLSQAIKKHYSYLDRSLLKLESLESVPHLGLQAELKDAQGNRFVARLGSTSWHRILQTEMSDEGRVQLKQHLSDGAQIALLSLNQAIVALIVFEDHWREDLVELSERLKRLSLKHVVISSSPRTLHTLPHASAVATNMFPIERRRQYGMWKEREPRAFEVVGPWDSPSETDLPLIEMGSPLQSAAEPSNSRKIKVFSDRSASIALVAEASRSWKRGLWIFGTSVSVMGLAIYGAMFWPVSAALLLITYGLSLTAIIQFELKAR